MEQKQEPNWVKLVEWWSVIALSRPMPRTGWNTIGLDRHQMDNLAAHHYMVTVIADFLSLILEKDFQVKLDRKRVIGMALLHDIGEVLLGADMATPQGLNPHYQEAKKAARRLEDRVISIFGQLLGDSELKNYMEELCKEERALSSDEAKLVKLADRIADNIHLRNVQSHPRFNRDDENYFDRTVFALIDTFENETIKSFCKKVGQALKSAIMHQELAVGVRPQFDNEQEPERALMQLFNHFQGTKRMVRTGWIPGRYQQHELDTLAEHGYMTAAMLLMLTSTLTLPNSIEVLDMPLFHEAGKLYGGGMSVLFNVRDESLKKDIDLIRQTTIDHLAESIGYPETRKYFLANYQESNEHKTDGAKLHLLVGRLADQIHGELIRRPTYTDRDREHREKAIITLAASISTADVQKAAKQFTEATFSVIEGGKLRRSIFRLLEE